MRMLFADKTTSYNTDKRIFVVIKGTLAKISQGLFTGDEIMKVTHLHEHTYIMLQYFELNTHFISFDR